MKANGTVIPEDVCEAVVDRMRSSSFVASELADHATRLLSQEFDLIGKTLRYTAKRLADRLIQKHRKAGDITRHGLVWEWNSEGDSGLGSA